MPAGGQGLGASSFLCCCRSCCLPVSAAHVRTCPGGEAYGGVFVGAGRTENRVIDPQGFAHWGRHGWATDYDGTDLAGGLLVGREFTLNGARFRVEFDGVFGDMSAQTDRVDPQGRDETAGASLRWATTARVGVEQTEGPVTVLFNGGVAVAGIENSVPISTSSRTCLHERTPTTRSMTDPREAAGSSASASRPRWGMPGGGAWTVRIWDSDGARIASTVPETTLAVPAAPERPAATGSRTTW